MVIAVVLASRGPRWWRAAMFGTAASISFAFTAACTKVVSDYAASDWLMLYRHWQTYALALFGMLGVFAEFEHSIIVERVKAGMVRAKSQGKHVGRPSLSADTKRTVLDAIMAGQSNRAAAKMAGISEAAVRRMRKSA